jgi:hypothetical protein
MGFDTNFEKLIISLQARSRDLACNDISRDPACNDISRDLACNDISRDLACNDISRDPARNGISRDDGFNGMSRAAAYVSRIAGYRRRFIDKYNLHSPFPKFKWQGSFHDHIIRDRKDFLNHLAYIRRQWLKHKLPENKYCFIDHAMCAKEL